MSANPTESTSLLQQSVVIEHDGEEVSELRIERGYLLRNLLGAFIAIGCLIAIGLFYSAIPSTVSGSPTLSMAQSSTADMEQRLAKIDLSEVIYKFQSHSKFNSSMVQLVGMEYLRFLGLHILYPNTGFAPSPLVDKMWHEHILFTAKYAGDCQVLFGHFLHHEPDVSAMKSKNVVVDGSAPNKDNHNQKKTDPYRHVYAKYVELRSTLPILSDLVVFRYTATFGTPHAEIWPPTNLMQQTGCKSPNECKSKNDCTSCASRSCFSSPS